MRNDRYVYRYLCLVGKIIDCVSGRLPTLDRNMCDLHKPEPPGCLLFFFIKCFTINTISIL